MFGDWVAWVLTIACYIHGYIYCNIGIGLGLSLGSGIGIGIGGVVALTLT